MATRVVPVRGTQSFVHTLSECWRRKDVWALEVAWRWLYGAPALALLFYELRKVLLAATDGTMDLGTLGLDPALLNDPVGALTANPMGATGKFAAALGALRPGVEHAAVWLLPLLLLGWVAASAVGRTLVLRRLDARMRARPVTLALLHALRVAVLTAVCLLWLRVVGAIGHAVVTGPVASGQDPDLVLYCGLVIVVSLGIFVAWGTVSWVFSLAPLLAMERDENAVTSLRDAVREPGMRGQMVEVNLVLGIVKIVLLVLAMTFSATPLPFESVTTPGFLASWWAGVALLYVLWSDFFHVARLVAYRNLWNSFDDA